MYNRHTELLIAVTYYNEDRVLFSRTLHGIMQNVRDICNVKRSGFWNKAGPAWQKIVVCLLLDGIDPLDKDVLDVLGSVGAYQDGVMKKHVDGRETIAHIFEHTTQLSITANQQLIRPHDDSPTTLPPVQIITCLKQKNLKKINSHRWLFHAFGRLLNPEICVLLDVGTKPGAKSILNMWARFYNDKDLGGACGKIHPMLGRGCWHMFQPLLAAQNFEYKVNCILDKPLESAFGYLSVLPGAYSAYGFRAIVGRPLEQYFHGDVTLARRLGKKGLFGMNAFQRNLFLAEDWIISFELFMKAGARWHMDYVKEATADTDVPEDVSSFISQRRRWLNGAFASTVYSTSKFYRFHKSGHSLFRLGLFYVQILYNIVSLLLSWFGLAVFLLSLFIINDISAKPPAESTIRPFPFGSTTPVVNAVIEIIYLVTVVLQFVLALGSKPKNEKSSYVISFMIFGVIQGYFMLNVVYLMVRVVKDKAWHNNGGDSNYISTFYSDIGSLTVIVTCCALFGVYYAASFLHLDPWHMFVSYPQYLFVSSAYTNILNIYAFSNWHDVSWGTEGEDDAPAFDALPSVRTRGDSRFVEEVARPQRDIDSTFEEVVKRALTPYVPRKEAQKPEIILEQAFKSFRTRLVAVYIFSNFLLCIFVKNESFDNLKFLVGEPIFSSPTTHSAWNSLISPSFRVTRMHTRSGSSESGCGPHLDASFSDSLVAAGIYLGLANFCCSARDEAYGAPDPVALMDRWMNR